MLGAAAPADLASQSVWPSALIQDQTLDDRLTAEQNLRFNAVS